MTVITAPVGRRGNLAPQVEMNRSADVSSVQTLLNHHAQSSGLTQPLQVTGQCDESTMRAIETFQRQVVGLRRPDGRVDPGGRTIRALDNPPVTPGASRRGVLPASALRHGLILAPAHNSPARRADATGAFHPGAQRFQTIHRLPDPVLFDNLASEGERRRVVLDAIQSAPGPLDVIAYFGHGTVNGLSSAGFRSQHVGELAEAIRANTRDGAPVVLYACSAGSFGGFAEALAGMINVGPVRDEYCRVVYGHTCSGHSFYNPYVTHFPSRAYVIQPGSSEFGGWRTALRSSDLWARFPFLNDGDIRAEIVS